METAMKANKITPDDRRAKPRRYKSASRPINWVHPIVQPRSANARPAFCFYARPHTRVHAFCPWFAPGLLGPGTFDQFAVIRSASTVTD